MPWVSRDSSGKLTGVYGALQPDYAEEFLEDSNPSVAAFLTPPPPVPTVTPVQGRIALLNAGLLTRAQAAVSAAGGATAIWWEYSTIWERSHPEINTLGSALGLTDAAIDLLFKQAASIK